jgi:hypothetical protein
VYLRKEREEERQESRDRYQDSLKNREKWKGDSEKSRK